MPSLPIHSVIGVCRESIDFLKNHTTRNDNIASKPPMEKHAIAQHLIELGEAATFFRIENPLLNQIQVNTGRNNKLDPVYQTLYQQRDRLVHDAFYATDKQSNIILNNSLNNFHNVLNDHHLENKLDTIYSNITDADQCDKVTGTPPADTRTLSLHLTAANNQATELFAQLDQEEFKEQFPFLSGEAPLTDEQVKQLQDDKVVDSGIKNYLGNLNTILKDINPKLPTKDGLPEGTDSVFAIYKPDITAEQTQKFKSILENSKKTRKESTHLDHEFDSKGLPKQLSNLRSLHQNFLEPASKNPNQIPTEKLPSLSEFFGEASSPSQPATTTTSSSEVTTKDSPPVPAATTQVESMEQESDSPDNVLKELAAQYGSESDSSGSDKETTQTSPTETEKVKQETVTPRPESYRGVKRKGGPTAMEESQSQIASSKDTPTTTPTPFSKN